MTTPIFDTRSFPLVWLHSPARPLDADEAKGLITGLTGLLDDERPYVIINDGGPLALRVDEERAFVLWFKGNRERLARLCNGMVMVIPPGPAHDDTARQIIRATAAYPYVVTVVPDTETAVAWARDRLDRVTP